MRKAKTKAIAITLVDHDMVMRLTYYTLFSVALFILCTNPVFADNSTATAGVSIPSVPVAGGEGVSPMAIVLCRVVGMILDDVGRGLATLAVIVVGIGAMLGKVSWGMAMTVAVGIAVVFGAPALVGMLGVQGGGCSGGGMILAGGQYLNGGGLGYGAANDACYNSGANKAKDTMTSVKCGASTATDILGAIGGKGNADSGGLIGIIKQR